VITEEELARLECLTAAATKGPWVANSGGYDPPWVSAEVEDGLATICSRLNSDKDADFVAAARDAVPKLVAEVRRLRAIGLMSDGGSKA